jgi:hypothetical protein
MKDCASWRLLRHDCSAWQVSSPIQHINLRMKKAGAAAATGLLGM